MNILKHEDSDLGPADSRTRYEMASRVLEDLRELNSLCSLPIIVEGKKDEKSLMDLGFTGPIEKLNRGWDIEKFCAYILETYGTRNACANGFAVEVLMDWDRTGGRLQKKLVERLEGLDIKVRQECRVSLSKALKPETRYVESLNSLQDRLMMEEIE